ncbi:hypothetical protein VSR68_27855 [Paraburkholderia phymatum]|uniref:hypothetical protein n=1 Tax=Paraburkholderia phymatum TaxID=148447 RepID=UPI0031756691
MRRLLFIAAFITCTIGGGWLLACFVTSFPFEMPVFLYRLIRFSIAVSGYDGLDNPEDIQTLGLVCLVVACWLVAALTFWLAMLAISRWRRSPVRT